MSYIIEDGKGSTVKAEVSADHLRTLAYSPSLLNHISGEITEKFIPPEAFFGEGVYTSRSSNIISSSLGNNAVQLIQNIDPINILIIDRIYINVFLSGTLPVFATNKAAIVSILFPSGFTGGTQINPINENRSINNLPNIRLLSLPTASFGGVGLPINQQFLVQGITELISMSDGVILESGNILMINIGNISGSDIGVESYMRFAIIDPNELI